MQADEAVVRTAVGRWGTVVALDDSRCVLRMTSDSFDWPAMALGSIGADFTVVSPPELVDHLRQWGERFTRATRAS